MAPSQQDPTFDSTKWDALSSIGTQTRAMSYSCEKQSDCEEPATTRVSADRAIYNDPFEASFLKSSSTKCAIEQSMQDSFYCTQCLDTAFKSILSYHYSLSISLRPLLRSLITPLNPVCPNRIGIRRRNRWMIEGIERTDQSGRSVTDPCPFGWLPSLRLRSPLLRQIERESPAVECDDSAS